MKHRIEYSSEESGYVAYLEDEPQVSGFGATKAKALSQLEVAKAKWIADGPIPGEAAVDVSEQELPY